MIFFSVMVNSWSLLYDELKMNEYLDSMYPDIPDNLDEPIVMTDVNTFAITTDMIPSSPVTPWKYNEEEIVKELLEYIRGTYNQHYSAGDDQIQTLDLIEACGDGEAFCRSNILKYASRYDKKGTARRDIMKIMHYAVLLMNFNDKNAQRETYPQ